MIDFAWLAVASALLAALLIVIAMTRNGPQDIRRTRILQCFLDKQNRLFAREFGIRKYEGM